MSGDVVGINSAIYSKDGGSLGIGFAIPSEMVATLLAAEKAGQVTTSGSIIRPWVGLTAQSLTADLASSLGLKTPTGALISDVQDESPAQAAGLKQGDVVISVAAHPIHDAAEFRFRLAMVPLGEPVAIGYKRNGDELVTHMAPIAPPDKPARDVTLITGRNPLQGASLMNINPAVEVELGLKNVPSKGVVVGAVDPRGLAARVVRVGDVILAVNTLPVNSPSDAQKAVQKPTNQGWVLKISSGGQVRTLLIR